MTPNGAFDDLATEYDRYRPRYPAQLAEAAIGPRRNRLKVVDAGAGTGICLEWLLPPLHEPEVHAIDISAGMARAGQEKFPSVTWHVGQVEEILPTIGEVDLIVAGQAYQWFDRPAFLAAAAGALHHGGRLAVVQNNRDHASSATLSAYEGLLEAKSPGYTRGYRQIDIARELAEGLGVPETEVLAETADWAQQMAVADFVGMSSRSTQVQRAIKAVGLGFLEDVRRLAQSHATDGQVSIAYRTELFVAEVLSQQKSWASYPLKIELSLALVLCTEIKSLASQFCRFKR